MTTDAPKTDEIDAVRLEIAAERDHLADAVDDLRHSAGPTAQLQAKLREKLPMLLVAAFAAGFVLSGGIGATARLIFRRGREGRTAARAGRFKLVERR
jgi:hypothetical protein